MMCKCRICGRFFDSQYSGSLSYCSQGCVDRYVQKKEYEEIMRHRRAIEKKMRREQMLNDLGRGGGQLGSRFRFRKVKSGF